MPTSGYEATERLKLFVASRRPGDPSGDNASLVEYALLAALVAGSLIIAAIALTGTV